MHGNENIESYVDRANALAAQLDAREYLYMPKKVSRARTKSLLEPFHMQVSRLLMFVLQRCCAKE